MTPEPAPTAHPWSPAQRLRLEGEWRALLRAFAFHPRVAVTPAGEDDPPREYEVRYDVTTLAVNEAGALAWVTAVPVHVWLPPHFPHEAPVIRPLLPVFHPNVTMEWVHLNPPWHPHASLAEVVTQVGRVLAFQAYDPDAVMNPVAMNWVYTNPHLLPTDPAGDFTASAGGEPLARLLRFGPAALGDVRREAEALLDRVTSGGAAPAGPAQPPSRDELHTFARRARLVTTPFADRDVPEALCRVAAEVEEVLDSLEGQESVWEQLKRHAAMVRALASTAGDLVRAEDGLWKAVAHLDAAAPRAATDEMKLVGSPLDGLPPLAVIQPLALGLRRAVRDAEGAVEELRQGLQRLATPPRPPPARRGGLVARRLERELAKASERAESARASGAALASLEPVLQRARRELLAVERVVAWSEYADLLARGAELARGLVAAGPGGIQVYSVLVGAEPTGPFPYEQRVELIDRSIAVSNPRGRMVRVLDAVAEQPLAAGEGEVPLPGTGAVVSPAEHTDELRVRFEYLLTQTREALARVEEPLDPEQYDRDGSWADRAVAALDVPAARERVLAAHHAARELWKALLADLAALGRLRQRQATHHLLARLEEFAPRALSHLERLRGVAERAGQRLGEIAGRSQADPETDRLIVPHWLVGDYAEAAAERDAASRQARRTQESLDRLVARARARLSKPARLGSAAIPRFQALPPLPEAEEEATRGMDDRGIAALVGRLEKLIGTTMREPGRPAPRPPRPPDSPAAVAEGLKGSGGVGGAAT